MEIVRDTTTVENTTPIPVVVEQVVRGEVVIMPAGTIVPIVDKSTVISIIGDTKGDPGPAGPPGSTGPTGPPGPAGPANLVVSQTNPNLSQNGLWVELNADGTLKTMWVVTV